jgi:hypothetical protein
MEIRTLQRGLSSSSLFSAGEDETEWVRARRRRALRMNFILVGWIDLDKTGAGMSAVFVRVATCRF